MTACITNRGSLVQHVLEQVIYVIVHLSTVNTACKYAETVIRKISKMRLGMLSHSS